VRLISNTRRQALNRSTNRLALSSPANNIYKLKLKLEELNNKKLNSMKYLLSFYHQRLEACNIALGSLNPHNVLKRGYSITRKLPHGDIVSDAASIDLDQSLEIILARGVLHAQVTAKDQKE
jgi:exodeoxyribonuclease VII large subunit